MRDESGQKSVVPRPRGAERRAAGEAFRDAHPIYNRMIARMLPRLNGLEGDPEEAVLRNLPMLGLRRVGSRKD